MTFCHGNKPATGIIGPENSLVGKFGDGVGTWSGNTVYALANGNYVVASPSWNLGDGAVTWGSGDTGVRGDLTTANSIFGVRNTLSFYGRDVYTLKNGNYIIASRSWAPSSSSSSYGIVTWCDGSKPTTGVAGPSNSICGKRDADWIGGQIIVTPDDDYLIIGTNYDLGAIQDVGSITWCSGTAMCKGYIDSTNSLVGYSYGDLYNNEITILPNGDYIVASPYWDNGSLANVGAVTYCDSGKALKGRISKSNSIIGSHTNDRIGSVLINDSGQYIIYSPLWDNGDSTDAGIVFWNDGSKMLNGEIDPKNSLAGERKNDRLGYTSKVLKNGNFVTASQYWSNGTVTSAGAATWIDKNKGIKGKVSITNSLIGSQKTDYVGSIIIPLANGHYVVNSLNWNNGSINDAGAVTWGDGFTGSTGYVGKGNSLVGSSPDDRIGFIRSVVPLSNGNYVVGSDYWDNGNIVDAGAATFIDGTKPFSGVISHENSIIGTHPADKVSRNGIWEIGKSNYLVQSSWWDNDDGKRVGALTWCDGTGKTFGAVNRFNSLVGIGNGDSVGFIGNLLNLKSIDGRYYYIENHHFDDGAQKDVGFVSIADSKFPLKGEVGNCNSFIGEIPGRSYEMHYSYNPVFKFSIIARPLENKVIIYTPDRQELSVSGNQHFISNHSTLTTIKNHTYFNETNICGSPSVRTYTIKNQGTKPIHIKTKPKLRPLIKNDSSFQITSIFGDTTILEDSMTLNVEFSPSSAGEKMAMIEFISDDCISDTFRFQIAGKGVEPGILVKGNNVTIVNGDTSIQFGDSTDFGTLETIAQRSFKIANDGQGFLNISGVKIVGKDALNFKAKLYSNRVNQGELTDLEVKFEPTGLSGPKRASVIIYSDDCEDSIHTFAIGADQKLNSTMVQDMNNLVTAQYRIFPNPATGFIQIEFNDLTEHTSVSLINVLGQILIDKPAIEDRKVSLELEGIYPGTYLLQVGIGARKSSTWIVIH